MNSESSFEVGDRVEITEDNASGAAVSAGDKGTIMARLTTTLWRVKMDEPRRAYAREDGSHWAFGESVLRKLTEAPKLTTEYQPGVTLPAGTKLRVIRGETDRPGCPALNEVVVLVVDDNTRSRPYSVRFNDSVQWLRRVDVEIVEDEEGSTMAESTESAHARDIRLLSEELLRMAREHNYCSDFDSFVERMNAQLTVKLTGRVPDFTFQRGDVVSLTSASNTFLRMQDGSWMGPYSTEWSDDVSLLRAWSGAHRLVLRDGRVYAGSQPGE